MKKRNYTKEDVKQILAEQGAELIEDQLLNEKLGTKDTVLFQCAEEDCLNKQSELLILSSDFE